MKALLQSYLHCWRLGVVAFITFVLSQTVVKAIVTLTGLLGLAQGSMLANILVTGIPFVLIGVPALGWIFRFASQQAASLGGATTESAAPATPPAAKAATVKIKGRAKSRSGRPQRMSGAPGKA